MSDLRVNFDSSKFIESVMVEMHAQIHVAANATAFLVNPYKHSVLLSNTSKHCRLRSDIHRIFTVCLPNVLLTFVKKIIALKLENGLVLVIRESKSTRLKWVNPRSNRTLIDGCSNVVDMLLVPVFGMHVFS